MTKSAIAVGATLALGLTLLAGLSWADKASIPQDPEALMKALQEAGTPGAEHKRLEPLAGQWTYTSKFWMDPGKPPMESTGTIERHWILGGRFLEERVTGKGPDGSDFEGRGVIGYDKPQGKYNYGWISTMGTGIATGVGTSDASGKHFTFQTEEFCPIRHQKIQGREELRVTSADKHVLEFYQTDEGKEVKMMELTAVRKK